MKQLSSLTQGLHQSDIRSVTARVDAVNGINLGQGICDMPAPATIKKGAKKAIDQDQSIYAPFSGAEPLVDRIMDKVKSFNQISIKGAENILVTAGSTGAFATAGFDVPWPEGAYYVLASLRPLSGYAGFKNDQIACSTLIDRVGIGRFREVRFIPTPKTVNICFGSVLPNRKMSLRKHAEGLKGCRNSARLSREDHDLVKADGLFHNHPSSQAKI